MLSGFDMFKTRDKYLVLEESRLPLLYRLFYSTFVVGRNMHQVPGVYLESINQVAGVLDQKISAVTDFIVYDFLSFEESTIYSSNSYQDGDDVLKQFWPIAECNSNKTILVGVNPENYDKIYIENMDLFADGSRFKFIASNIFEFITMFSYVERSNIGYGIEDYSCLYKEWNELNWKIKPIK